MRFLFSSSSSLIFGVGGVGKWVLFGKEGDDYFHGSQNDDFHNGGNDTIISGSDSDRFMLSLQRTNIITDFTPGEDFLDLPENIIFSDLEWVTNKLLT